MSKILLIEDSEPNRALILRVLEAQSYDLICAENGETGIEMAVNHKPDLVLIDIGLPDIDGHTVLSLLKQVSDLEKTKFVAFTAWPPELAAEICERYGYDGVITKPITVKGFLAQVGGFLQT